MLKLCMSITYAYTEVNRVKQHTARMKVNKRLNSLISLMVSLA
jgi:hypothetical protein